MNDPRLVQFAELIKAFTDEDLDMELLFQSERIEMMESHTIYPEEAIQHARDLKQLVIEEQQRRYIP